MDAHYYEVNVKWIEQRKGTLSAPTLETISVATPPEFPKGHPGIWSPEHYFVSAVNGCLMTTFLAVAENSKLSYKGFECKAIGKLEKVEGKYMISEIELAPRIVIENEADKDKALKVIEKSEAACLISNSIKSKIILKPLIEIDKTVAL
jgi:organic hydroperoxide reductase OsmC/OhrA